jgi:hypothetical protein
VSTEAPREQPWAPTWLEVANLLADRLGKHDYCPDGHQDLDPGPYALGCPFCADRFALQLFRQRKALG